jgi:uncharacterized protein YkvS
MAYKIKTPKTKERDFENERIMEIQRKGKRFPKFQDITQTATENVTGITAQKRRKGEIIQYDGKIGVVKRSTKKDVIVNLGDSDDFLDVKKFKEVKIPSKDFNKHAEPIYIPSLFPASYPLSLLYFKR